MAHQQGKPRKRTKREKKRKRREKSERRGKISWVCDFLIVDGDFGRKSKL